MKGLELAKRYYTEYGLPMIERDFAEYKDRIAVGLVGHGSECFGYDDGISTDHDFEPGFCIWLTEEDERKFGFKLFRAYSKLPKEYMGVKVKDTSLFGSEGKGVKTIGDFYSYYIGGKEVPVDNRDWLLIPDYYLAEATNGEIFADPLGEFSRIRQDILNRPEDVTLKKLASSVFNMAQTGQYGYHRCLSHGEKGSAGIALSEFVKSATHAVYLLDRKYMPYYKWMFRGMDGLKLGYLKDDLVNLMDSPYDEERNTVIIERICRAVADEIRSQGLSERTEDYLEGYSYCIKNKITDNNLRNSSVIN